MRLAKRRKVRPDDPVAVVTRFLDAANHHDADGLRTCVHPEFESFQPLHPARNFRGAGQLISNWKAIFEAEPGFRLTLLRASTTGNTVWAEIHGAGASAEAAGIFIVGVEDRRIRWIRVYSDLVEPLPEEPVEEAPGPAVSTVDWDRDPIRLAPPPDSTDGEAAEETGEEAEEEPAGGGEEPEVAAASAEAPGLRLVVPDTVEEEKATEDEASPPHPPEVVGAAEAEGDESIEVLVGDAPRVEVGPPDQRADLETEEEVQEDVPSDQPADPDAEEEAPADAPVAAEKQAFDPAPASSEADGDPGRSSSETVARLGGGRPEPSGTEGQPARRRLGFLRRGGRGSGS